MFSKILTVRLATHASPPRAPEPPRERTAAYTKDWVRKALPHRLSQSLVLPAQPHRTTLPHSRPLASRSWQGNVVQWLKGVIWWQDVQGAVAVWWGFLTGQREDVKRWQGDTGADSCGRVTGFCDMVVIWGFGRVAGDGGRDQCRVVWSYEKAVSYSSVRRVCGRWQGAVVKQQEAMKGRQGAVVRWQNALAGWQGVLVVMVGQ